LPEEQVEQIEETVVERDLVAEANAAIAEIESEEPEEQENIPCFKCGTTLLDAPGIGLFCPNKECDVVDNVHNADPIVFVAPTVVEEAEVKESKVELEEEEEDPTDSAEVKKAKAKWKAENPQNTLKEQRRLVALGQLDSPPWEKYLEPVADFSEDEAAEEAAKWAQEQIDLKKKDSKLDGESGLGSGGENSGEVGYTQNAEQGEETLWNKLKQVKE
jgi:hypothetical protein